MAMPMTVDLRVKAIGDTHVIEVSGGLVAGHSERVKGCPWCVPDAEEKVMEDMLRALYPSEWWTLLAHTSRYLIAWLDLNRPDSPGVTATFPVGS